MSQREHDDSTSAAAAQADLAQARKELAEKEAEEDSIKSECNRLTEELEEVSAAFKDEIAAAKTAEADRDAAIRLLRDVRRIIGGYMSPGDFADLRAKIDALLDKSSQATGDTPSDPAVPTTMGSTQIKYMVDRFLGWPLSANFNPDGGISFTPHPMVKPSGTNLFDATQAEAMVRHMVDGMPQEPAKTAVSRSADWNPITVYAVGDSVTQPAPTPPIVAGDAQPEPAGRLCPAASIRGAPDRTCGWAPMSCVLADGHSGAHASGEIRWTDSVPVAEPAVTRPEPAGRSEDEAESLTRAVWLLTDWGNLESKLRAALAAARHDGTMEAIEAAIQAHDGKRCGPCSTCQLCWFAAAAERRGLERAAKECASYADWLKEHGGSVVAIGAARHLASFIYARAAEPEKAS